MGGTLLALEPRPQWLCESSEMQLKITFVVISYNAETDEELPTPIKPTGGCARCSAGDVTEVCYTNGDHAYLLSSNQVNISKSEAKKLFGGSPLAFL